MTALFFAVVGRMIYDRTHTRQLPELGGLAQVAETRYWGDRLLVRRTRLTGAQAQLFPNWRYHAFVTDRVATTLAPASAATWRNIRMIRAVTPQMTWSFQTQASVG